MDRCKRKMLTLVIPSYAGGENIERTIRSVPMADDLVIISTALFAEDEDHFHSLTSKVVTLPWNYVFHHGFGAQSNQGTAIAKNDWLLLFGVGETLAEYGSILIPLQQAAAHVVFKCWHHNDVHHWRRVWNRTGGTQWHGVIHEDIVGGSDGGLLFRMQDTEKTPFADVYKQETLRFMKLLSYHYLYHEVLIHPERLGRSNGWHGFIQSARQSFEATLLVYRRMIDACLAGDKQTFLDLVREDVDTRGGCKPTDFNFKPQGT